MIARVRGAATGTAIVTAIRACRYYNVPKHRHARESFLCERLHHSRESRASFAALCAKTSSTAEKSGRPFRMRADHSWPQRRQLYQATIQVLSGAGSTDRPQAGQDIAAAVENVWNMPAPRATLVPTAAPHRTRQTSPTRLGVRGITSANAKNIALCRRRTPPILRTDAGTQMAAPPRIGTAGASCKRTGRARTEQAFVEEVSRWWPHTSFEFQFSRYSSGPARGARLPDSRPRLRPDRCSVEPGRRRDASRTSARLERGVCGRLRAWATR
jgi:hypothetical protein